MRFLSVTLLSLVLCASLYGAFVYIVNPRGEFAPAYFPRVVLPDREAKLRLFEQFAHNAPPTGLVLGSSRSMKLKPSELEKVFGGRFFNFAVTSATVEDYGSIYDWVRQHGVKPRVLVIGLDVEALHSDEQYNAMLNVPELRAAFEGKKGLPELQRITQALRRTKNSYTLGYFVDAMDSIRLKLWPAPARWSFDSDGYVRYLLSEHQRATGTFDYSQAMAESAVRYRKTYQANDRLSARRCAYLEDLIRRAQADGARVLVWITPLHPQALPEVERGTPYAQLVEQTAAYLDSLRNRDHIATADLHDPAAFGGSASYWYDCVHYDEPAAQRIIAMLAGSH